MTSVCIGKEITMKIIEVTDLNRPELAVYAELSERQLATIYEPEEGLFITESPKVIERALDGGYEPVSYTHLTLPTIA
mgnify:CR=1 FL=1